MTDKIEKLLQQFYPSQPYSKNELGEKIEKGEILTKEEDILPFLQTALFDEKILEVELNKRPELYFSRLQDTTTAVESSTINNSGEQAVGEYSPGDYLYDLDYIVTLPLEPGLGSLRLRQSSTILLRMFTKDFGIEMGTTFRAMTRIDDLPVLQLSYPTFARIEPNSREFRAKVPDHHDFTVEIEREDGSLEINTKPIDVSRKGMAIAVDKLEQRQLKLDDELFLKLYIEDELRARLSSRVRHLSKIRKRMGIEYRCGVEFDLSSRTITSVMESIVAATQRAHLKALAEIAASRGIELLP